MTTTPAASQPGSDAFLARLPIGESLPIPDGSLVTWDIFPLEGEMRVKPLQAPVLPEPPRNGEDGPEGCEVCDEPLDDALWADEHWRVDAATDPSGLPALVKLKPRGHYDLSELPPERAAEIGPMLQRVERAIMSLGGVARVHINKWGDGGAHLHFWLLGRPAGMMQLRGTVLSIWDDLLPRVPDEERHLANRRIAAALATDSGKAYAL